VHVQELIEEGDNVRVGDVKRLSLLDGIAWLCSVYPDEALQVGLGQATTDLADWISAERDVTFWCGDLGKTISLKMSRGRLINFAANYSKHGLLRTRRLMQGLSGYTKASGLVLSLAELASLRDSFRGEIENRLLYLSSWLVELIGAFWYALNELVVRRLALQNTNDESKMRMPRGVAADFFRNLYGSTLVFKSYERERITRHVPRVSDLLKSRF